MQSENGKKNGDGLYFTTQAEMQRHYRASATTTGNWLKHAAWPKGGPPWNEAAVTRFLTLIGSPKVPEAPPDMGACYRTFGAFCEALDAYRSQLERMPADTNRVELIESLDAWLLRSVVWCAAIRSTPHAHLRNTESGPDDLPLESIIGDAMEDHA